MPSPSSLLLFLGASYALAVVPGPAVLYIVNQSVGRGRRAGVISAAGIATGGAVHVLAAALGLSAILASSAAAFSIVKYAGAAYLFYLGVRTLREDQTADGDTTGASSGRIFRRAVVVNVLNPKTALFFLAFLPQFVDPGRGSVLAQVLLLGAMFVTAALSSDLVYAWAAAAIQTALARRAGLRTVRRWTTATVLIGLGGAAAFAK